MPRRLLLIYSLLSLFVVSSALAQNTSSIEGTLLMLDDETLHVAVPVQAIRNGEVIATVLSDENGRYQFIDLMPGRYQLRCQVLNGYVYYGEEKARGSEDGTAPDEPISLKVEQGRTFRNTDFRFAPFKKGSWRHYGPFEGLAHNTVNCIYVEPDGVMWFGTQGAGISRYDGKEFLNFTIRHGLGSVDIKAIHRDPDGVMWFGTWAEGVSLYDGKEFTTFNAEDGLAGNGIYAIHRDPDGVMWFATDNGVCCYDGKEFVSFTTEDGLAHNFVWVIHREPGGILWFGTWGGVSRYDGSEFTNFTTKDGLAHNRVNAIHRDRDRDGVMWFGTKEGVSRYDGKEFVNFTTEDGLPGNWVSAIHRDPDGVMWFGTWGGGISRYDGKTFVNFTKEDGLPCNVVQDIHINRDGVVWIGTGTGLSIPPERGGISCYDTRTFVNFTTRDGLPNDAVSEIHIASDGVMWIGTLEGVSRYDGEKFINFTVEDGLASNIVNSIESGPDGILWFGTGAFYAYPPGSGVSRYDGERFITFTTEDGLADNTITDIYCDPDGVMWFGTVAGGVSRYDGKEFANFANFTAKDGLEIAQHPSGGNWVTSVCRDPDGAMWFGTGAGVSRYDGKEFVNFTTEDGLASNGITSIWHYNDGSLWFGTWGSGVSQYDGKRFVTFSTEDGLAGDIIHSIYCDSYGVLWFGTDSKGVSGYDGTAWTSLDTRDGLAGGKVNSICQDADGFLWFGTNGGLTCYRRSMTSPKVRIASVTTDLTYDDLSAIPAFTPGTRVTIEYSSFDFKTIPEKRQYRWRVYETQDPRRKTQDEELRTQDSLESGVLDLGPSEAYNPPTRETSFDWAPRESGTYTFQVQAIDRDLNYSEPASLVLSVVPPFYLRAAFLIPTIGSGAVVLAIVVFLATALTKRRRQVHAYQQLAVQELQDAREMQMSLLPEAAPPVEGMEIAGRSTPANTVGGDFFDYLPLTDEKVGIAIADISGKGLRAAMNAVMTSGMLYEVVKTEMSGGSILSELNAGLCPRMEKQTFLAFSFAILSQNSERIQWSNAAQPRPLIKRGDSVSEVQGEGELPLGIMPDVAYPDHELQLQAGDIVVLYTDGIIEAENEAEEMYGAERLEGCVTGIDSAMSAEEVIEAILKDVSDFAGSAQQYDDMTVVVVKRL